MNFVLKQKLFQEHGTKIVTCTSNSLNSTSTKHNMFQVNSKHTDTDKN